MLKEIRSDKNKEDGLHKRWFSDDLMDLIVWSHDDGTYYKFQLCYDKSQREHALTWTSSKGFFHNRVNDGEYRQGKYKETPILELDGVADVEVLANNFKDRASDIDTDICRFVSSKLNSFPNP